MRAADYARLIGLGAITGSAFMFMRIAAPVVGPAVTTDGRLLIAGAALVLWAALSGQPMHWRSRWRAYVLIGALNAGMPFFLLSFAAQHIPASLSALLNATAPMFGALCGLLWLNERMTARKLIGLVTGLAGVAVLSGVELGGGGPLFAWSVAACLVASMCFGIGGVVLHRYASRVGGAGVSAGAMSTSGILLLPTLAIWPPTAAPTMAAALSVLMLGLVCTAGTYWLYVRLITNVGVARALTSSYLVPLFGLLWGMLFLGESLRPGSLAGGALIILGTILVVSGREGGKVR